MNRWTVLAYIRKRNAIGIFHRHTFEVTSGTSDNVEEVKQDWFRQHGETWELHHVVSIALWSDTLQCEFAPTYG